MIDTVPSLMGISSTYLLNYNLQLALAKISIFRVKGGISSGIAPDNERSAV